MPVVGPMLATLMSMSNGAQVPVACQTDLEGVTIRLGERVSFFVGLPHCCDLDDDATGAGSGDLAATLHAASDEPAAEADKPAAASDEPAADEGEVAVADPERPAVSSDESEAPAPEPQVVAEVTNEDAASESTEPWVDPEEAVTMRQIAEANSVSESDPEAAPRADSDSASADAVASADDATQAEADQPADAEPSEAPQLSTPATGVGSDGADLDTGPDLISAAQHGWLDRFAQVREDVRNAFRLDASLWHGRPARASDVTR